MMEQELAVNGDAIRFRIQVIDIARETQADTYNVLDELCAGDVLCKGIGEIGQDRDVEQVEEQLKTP